MAGSTLTLTYNDAELKGISERLKRILGNTDFKPLLALIGGALRESAVLRFQQGKAPDGSKWKESARALMTGGQTLILKGRLRDSIASVVADKQSVEVGSNVEYAAIHQFGGVLRPRLGKSRALRILGVGFRRSAKMPARPYLGISSADEEEIMDITRAWLKRLVSL